MIIINNNNNINTRYNNILIYDVICYSQSTSRLLVTKTSVKSNTVETSELFMHVTCLMLLTVSCKERYHHRQHARNISFTVLMPKC